MFCGKSTLSEASKKATIAIKSYTDQSQRNLFMVKAWEYRDLFRRFLTLTLFLNFISSTHIVLLNTVENEKMRKRERMRSVLCTVLNYLRLAIKKCQWHHRHINAMYERVRQTEREENPVKWFSRDIRHTALDAPRFLIQLSLRFTVLSCGKQTPWWLNVCVFICYNAIYNMACMCVIVYVTFQQHRIVSGVWTVIVGVFWKCHRQKIVVKFMASILCTYIHDISEIVTIVSCIVKRANRLNAIRVWCNEKMLCSTHTTYTFMI